MSIKHPLPYSKNTLAGLVLAIILIVFSLDNQATAAPKMPEFSLPAVEDGAIVASSSYKGKILLINFFATWCPPCRMEIPELITLQTKYSKQDFTVIGFSVDQGGRKNVKKFLSKLNVNYPVVMADDKTSDSFGGVAGIPFSFLIDRSGNIVKAYPGYIPPGVFQKDMEQIIQTSTTTKR